MDPGAGYGKLFCIGAHGVEYSNSAENFKQPKNREDGLDLDENLTESIAA